MKKTGFAFYYSGFVNLKEDELREKKVTHAKRTVNILQPIDFGVELIRSGGEMPVTYLCGWVVIKFHVL